ncbi:MAG: riboflavin biosynthesis protein RibF [Armatimonadota bacterium]|nr:riboflavin biosynthesis protein RibF [Armatimonadota bacterium]MDR7421731.1 riboflavin biosynthesis protein RibF [Armatimonadota bacterium]MDR7453716.1 riboflavin biosynthesis protein RibF [Armatimonadota bacterium]MDR7456409.1 riboflavin biosynthesis protein RibF [Armatimonadota bacterium]MDR7497805.1 riboflavin biosynthesis protein RibF [Armatimonadota bacterium]
MNVIRGLEAFEAAAPVAVALGTFDGLHRGHRAVIDCLREVAGRTAGQSVALTFDPHPLTVIALPEEPFLLSTLDERVELFAASGVDALVVVRFDHALRQLPPEQWLEQLAARLRPVHVVVSSTHAFGRDRQGTPEMLDRWARARGVGLTVVPPVRADGVVISSSGIRGLLRSGDVRTAAAWLGRWYGLRGRVVPGDRRGRQLGVPTANLDIPPLKLVPARGIYAAYATVAGATYAAAVSVGVRPTFGEGRLVVEVHLLGVEVDLYGQTLEVRFVERLRDEVRYPDVEALKAQMALDLRAAASALRAVDPAHGVPEISPEII